MSYDHHRKAGNEGDVCKHPALIAALDETVARTEGTPYRYADLYAGYAKNPLTAGQEWPNGIGVVAGIDLFGRNRHLALWACACCLQRKPGPGDTYPGSAWFAREVCNWRDRPAELWLWDDGAAPFADLQANFAHNSHLFNSRWVRGDPAIQDADFVFIDPPNMDEWPKVRDLIRRLEPRQGVLVWLPWNASKSEQYAREALEVGMGATTVRWARGGRPAGCHLFYRLIPEARRALRDVAEEVVRVARLKTRALSTWTEDPRHEDP